MKYCRKCKIWVTDDHHRSRAHRMNICRTCKFINFDQYEFTRHLNTHKKVKSITFPSCNKCSINKPKSEHFQTRSYNQNICWECGYETYDEDEFRYHTYTHCIDIMTIECTKCKFYSDVEEELYDHLKIHEKYTIDDFTEDKVSQCDQYRISTILEYH
jgi:hypothetical protein